MSVLGRQARELPGFSLAPLQPPSQGGGKLLDGCICLREGSRALEANTVNSINFVFYSGTMFVRTIQSKRLHVFRKSQRCQEI